MVQFTHFGFGLESGHVPVECLRTQKKPPNPVSLSLSIPVILLYISIADIQLSSSLP